MSSPIPRRMLPHVIVVEPYLRTEKGAAVYGAPVSVKFVRVEPVKQSAQKSLGDMKNDRFRIFVDRVNSMPVEPALKAKDRVTFRGTTTSVRAAEDCFGDGPEVHHWEVYCGG